MVLAQAILETGCGSSVAAKKKNNHFGLMSKGKTLHFNSTYDSVKYYLNNLANNRAYKKLRVELEKNGSDNNKILYLLSSTYAEDSEYSKKILRVIRSYNLSRFD